MKKFNLLCSLACIISCTTNLHAWWWSTNQQPTPEAVVQELERKQADSPDDPYTNYNLGVALYKAGKFSQAQTNFERAQITATQPELKKRCYFNMGNSLYKDAQSSLPNNWEQVEIPAETLDQALGKTSLAIKKYDSVLLLDKEHEPAKTNRNAAQDFLEKLAKKKQQQEQKKQDPKQDKNKEKDKQQQKQNNQQDQPSKQRQQQGDKDNKKQDSKEKPHNCNNEKKQGDNKQPQEKNNQDNQQDNQQQSSHDKAPQQQQPEQQPAPQPTPTPGQKQEVQPQAEGGKPENMEQRGMRALLDNLQQDESKLQKALVVKHLKENEKPRESSQRPW